MITSFYAAILALFFVVLSVHVVMGRGKYKVLIGDGGHVGMTRRIRAQANFIEYTPLFLILLLLAEQAGWQADYLHAAGAVFLLGRAAHAYAIACAEGEAAKGPSIFRMIGMISTFTPLTVLSVGLLVENF